MLTAKTNLSAAAMAIDMTNDSVITCVSAAYIGYEGRKQTFIHNLIGAVER